jgi:hypothetical protein
MQPSGTSETVVVLEGAAVLEEAADTQPVLCDTCPHPAAEHDAISSRYCAATLATALSRGCICK